MLALAGPLVLTQFGQIAIRTTDMVLIGRLGAEELAGGSLGLGKLAAGLLGLGLALAAFAAAGLYMSSLTAQPTVAAVSTFGLLLLVWIIDWAGQARDEASALFGWL